MDLHIAKRTAPLLIMDIIATYVAYWLASLLTNVFDEVFTSNEIFFILGIRGEHRNHGRVSPV